MNSRISPVIYVDPEIGVYWMTKRDSVSDENRGYSVSEERDTQKVQFVGKAKRENKEVEAPLISQAYEE